MTNVLEKPNGLCFSPDYQKLYIADTGAAKNIMVFDVEAETTLKGGKVFVANNAGWKKTAQGAERGAGTATEGCADGLRCDVDGNVWAAGGWVGAGFDGVHCFTAQGQLIGQIKLPEIAANLCFGGPKRNRLYIAASTSIYAVYVETQGAHFC